MSALRAVCGMRMRASPGADPAPAPLEVQLEVPTDVEPQGAPDILLGQDPERIDPGRERRAMEACLGVACVCAGDCADGSTLVCRAPSACVNEELSTATTRPLRSYCLVTTNVTWL